MINQGIRIFFKVCHKTAENVDLQADHCMVYPGGEKGVNSSWVD